MSILTFIFKTIFARYNVNMAEAEEVVPVPLEDADQDQSQGRTMTFSHPSSHPKLDC